MPDVIFSAKDIGYLVYNLSESQLKHERWRAGLEIHSCHTWPELEKDWFYWYDYHKALELAIEIVQSNKPKPKPIPGRIDIESLKQRNDIVSVIEQYTPLRKSGSRFTGRCPFHEDRNPSLTVYPDRQSFYCFSCNTGGDVVAFVEVVEHCEFKQAAAILGG